MEYRPSAGHCLKVCGLTHFSEQAHEILGKPARFLTNVSAQRQVDVLQGLKLIQFCRSFGREKKVTNIKLGTGSWKDPKEERSSEALQ